MVGGAISLFRLFAKESALMFCLYVLVDFVRIA
jgi:hypothetical protein